MELLNLNIGSFSSRDEFETVELPPDATVDDMIAKIGSPEGCVGFLVAPMKNGQDCYDPYEDDGPGNEPPQESSGLADKLTADGGTLLQPGKALSSYGLNSATCSEVTLFAVSSVTEKQPTVFKKDMQETGFGHNVYNYVKLNKEDKELVAARACFQPPLLPWLQKECPSEEQQSVTLSMEDDFAEAPKPILTVLIAEQGGELEVSCTNLAGDPMCKVKLAKDDIVAKLRSLLCEKLQWTSLALWNGSEKVPEAHQSSLYSLLTAERVVTMEHVQGCYQLHECGHHPAGYSSSGTSSSNQLTLEPGKACLQYCFRGDYKRAEELRRLDMPDARWSVELLPEGKHAIRIVGKARISKHFVHERSGPDGHTLNGYQCYALVTIPLQQLEHGQRESYHHTSEAGSGWSCGSDDYKCSFFLPMSLLNAVRLKPEGNEGSFRLRSHLNSAGSASYPQTLSTSRRAGVSRVSQEGIDLIAHLRERLAGKSDASMEEIMEMEALVPVTKKHPSDDEDE